MPDRDQFTSARPDSWEDQPLLREVALAFMPPNHARAAREISEFLFTAILEAGGAGCSLPAALRALALDLACCRDALRSVAADGHGAPAGLEKWRERLAEVERELVEEAGRLDPEPAP